MPDDMIIRFWGVRGSHPVPGPRTVRVGGNTACVEVQAGPHTIILDAGTGIINLGAGRPMLVVDLQQVPLIDSTGLEALVTQLAKGGRGRGRKARALPARGCRGRQGPGASTNCRNAP